MAFFDIREEIKKSPETRAFQIVGKRNVGKTYSTVRLIRDTIQNTISDSVLNSIINPTGNDQFIYLRRYKMSELDTAKNKVFSTVENCKIYNDGYSYYIKKDDTRKLCGYAVALSSIQKGIDFEKVKIILFDEYTITDNKRYLTGEFETFANFLETAIRLRNDCIVIMLGNAKNFYNPYTVGWNITLGIGQKRWTGCQRTLKYILVEGKQYDNKRENTMIGKLFKGTAYDEWANDNKFVANTGKNLLSKQKDSRCICRIKTNIKEFTIWSSDKGFIVSDSKSNVPQVFQLDFNNLQAGEQVFKRQNNQISVIKSYALHGMLFFETEKIKNLFMPVFNFIIGY